MHLNKTLLFHSNQSSFNTQYLSTSNIISFFIRASAQIYASRLSLLIIAISSLQFHCTRNDNKISLSFQFISHSGIISINSNSAQELISRLANK